MMLKTQQFEFFKKSLFALGFMLFGFMMVLLIQTSLVPVAHAEHEEGHEAASLEIDATCPGEYYGFILGARDEGTRKNYFKDFFTLSYCQISDMQKVYDELEALRDTFRSQAFACEDTSDSKEKYYELLMEVYFIRNLQKTSNGVFGGEADEEYVDLYKDLTIANLHIEMEMLFVDEHKQVDADTLDSYISKWSNEYEDRIGKYWLCDDGPWAELGESIDSFTETINYITSFKERMAEIEVSKGNSFTNIKNNGNFEATSNDQAKQVGQGIVNAWNYMKKIKDQNIAKKAEEEGIEVKSLEDAIADGDVSSIDSAFDFENSQDVTLTLIENEAERMARYELLYGNGGSASAATLQATVWEINMSLGTSNALLELMEVDAQTIYDKQCN